MVMLLPHSDNDGADVMAQPTPNAVRFSAPVDPQSAIQHQRGASQFQAFIHLIERQLRPGAKQLPGCSELVIGGQEKMRLQPHFVHSRATPASWDKAAVSRPTGANQIDGHTVGVLPRTRPFDRVN
jgi:hypothetical protein